MRVCKLCRKVSQPGNGTFFTVPKDKNRRKKWSEICGQHFVPTSYICCDHFRKEHLIKAGQKTLLMPNAFPDIDLQHRSQLSLSAANCSNIPQMFEENTMSEVQDQKPIYLVNKSKVNSVKQEWKILKEQDTQTESVIFAADMHKTREIIRNLQNEVKDLKLKLAESDLAINAMKTIFTEGQIRKLKAPGRVDWSWNDILEAIYLYAAGRNSYKYLYKKGFPLPHVSTLRRWCQQIDFNEGIFKKANDMQTSPLSNQDKSNENKNKIKGQTKPLSNQDKRNENKNKRTKPVHKTEMTSNQSFDTKKVADWLSNQCIKGSAKSENIQNSTDNDSMHETAKTTNKSFDAMKVSDWLSNECTNGSDQYDNIQNFQDINTVHEPEVTLNQSLDVIKVAEWLNNSENIKNFDDINTVHNTETSSNQSETDTEIRSVCDTDNKRIPHEDAMATSQQCKVKKQKTKTKSLF